MHVFSTGCPYSSLNDGPVMTRLADRSNRLHLLDYLLTDLEAMRINAANQPASSPSVTSTAGADQSVSNTLSPVSVSHFHFVKVFAVVRA